MKPSACPFSTLAPLLLTVLALAAPPAAADITADDTVEGIEHFSRYSGGETFAGSLVGFGGATRPEAMAWLKRQGFATVISLRQADEEGATVEANRAAATAAGLRYIQIPFNAEDPAADLEAEFLRATGDAANRPVYIHCGSATRASILWMIGRTGQDGLTADQARAEGAVIAGKPDKALEYFSKWTAAGAKSDP